jgi:hypothetical protein
MYNSVAPIIKQNVTDGFVKFLFQLKMYFCALARRRGAVDIASAKEIEDPGSNPTPGQGCQIFLRAKYQNGKKYTKFLCIIPNVHKV